jgi:hypothetical protein
MGQKVSNPRRAPSRSLISVGLISSLLLGGCGGSDSVEPGLVPVKGRVTLNGGPWPKPGALFFMLKDSSASERGGVATFDTAGVFESVEGGYGGAQGLAPGLYWVSVQCKEGDEEMPIPGKPVVVKNYVPANYQDPSTSGLTLQVDAGKPVEVVFEVKGKAN